MKENEEAVSRFLSLILRHRPDKIGVSLDREGWADIAELVKRANESGNNLDLEAVLRVVDSNDKKRFAISGDGTRIRAVQGHSTAGVDLKFLRAVPPSLLYHGTAARFLKSISTMGLLPGQRQYVHLSADPEAAASVGVRHGSPVVLVVAAGEMNAQGYEFYLAENGVWLTRSVPAEFLNRSPAVIS